MPDVTVVYVDNDPMVKLHSQDMVVGEEKIGAIAGDLRDPPAILGIKDLVAT